MSYTPIHNPLCSKTNLKISLEIATADTSQDDLLDLCIDVATSVINDYVQYPLLKPTSGEPTTEFYSGNGYEDLVLRRRPVQSVFAVYVHSRGFWGQGTDPFPATTLWVAGTDYALICDQQAGSTKGMAGLIRRLSSSAGSADFGWEVGMRGGTLANWGRGKAVWPPGDGNIKVVYTAGYTSLTDTTFPLPMSVQGACEALAVYLRKTIPQGGMAVTSESLGKYSVGFGTLADSGRNALAAAGELGSARQVLSRYRDMPL